jgi:hypothetical protein
MTCKKSGAGFKKRTNFINLLLYCFIIKPIILYCTNYISNLFSFTHLIESITNTSILPSFSQDSNIFRTFVTDDGRIHELKFVLGIRSRNPAGAQTLKQ